MMWDEQSTDQDSTPAPIVESEILESGGSHVIVKLLATSSVAGSNGNDVLAKFLTPAVTIGSASGILQDNVPLQGLRKIEPKPVESGNECQKLNEADSEAVASGGLLGIKATRRGVKTCPMCAKKIGYRSKQCKYCTPNKSKRKPQKRTSGESSKDRERLIDVEIGVVIETQTEVSTSSTAEVAPMYTSTEEVATKKEAEDSEPVSIESCKPDSQGSISAIESMDSEMTQVNNGELAAGKRNYHTSLQDLIQTLLVQNQNNSVYVVPEPEIQHNKVGEDNPASTQEEERLEEEEEVVGDQDSSVMATGAVGSPENVCDVANSVALFLGHLAQQNGKKMRSALDSVSNNAQPSMSAANPVGCKIKYVLVEDDLSSSVKYRKIRPKSVGEGSTVVEIQSNADSAMEGEVGEGVVDAKPMESQPRMLPGNATRRGVMPCQNCQSLIGCRSKVCKHCNFLLNEENPPFRRSKKHIVQAVRLQIPSHSVVGVFSVRRSKVGPDHRCFVWHERRELDNEKSDVFSCDHPPCVTTRELSNMQMTFLCEHAKICCGQGLMENSRVPELKQEKLSSDYFTAKVSDSLQELKTQCIDKGVPLVQGVSDRTFVVVDQLHDDQGSCIASNLMGFVHVRFERNKVGGIWQTQVCCSGRPCVAWNPVFSCISNKSSSLPTVLRSINCIHYSACLWAIISDEKLAREFKSYTEGAKAKANSNECD